METPGSRAVAILPGGTRPRAFVVGTQGNEYPQEIFSPEVRAKFGAFIDLDSRVVTPQNFGSLRHDLASAEILLGTWGFPVDLASALAALPKLRLVLYGAGSVKGFAEPFLQRGIPVVGGRDANAVAVAEFCLAQIILCNKGYFRNTRMCRAVETAHQSVAYTGSGNYGETIALLGYGAIARRLRKMLHLLCLRVLVVDPTIDSVIAQKEQIQLVSLDDAFANASVVSNHLPDLAQLELAITGRHFRLMRPSASFINTGRGRQVDESALAEVFREREDLTALLDVTRIEPPDRESPLYSLPNVQISSHIAGVVGDERRRLTDLLLQELSRFLCVEPLQHASRIQDLELMA